MGNGTILSYQESTEMKMLFVNRYIITGRVILEISGIRSLNRYPGIPEHTEKRKRWIAFELLESIINESRKYGERFLDSLKQSLMNPCRSKRNIMKNMESIRNGAII